MWTTGTTAACVIRLEPVNVQTQSERERQTKCDDGSVCDAHQVLPVEDVLDRCEAVEPLHDVAAPARVQHAEVRQCEAVSERRVRALVAADER